MRVLIGVDDSAESRDAVTTAFELFGPAAEYTIASVGRRQASGLLFTAGFPGSIYGNGAELADQFSAAESAAEETARSAQEHLPTDADAVVEGEVGHVGRQLCRMAADEQSNVVVIGSHDRGVWERLLDPSVGRYLIDNAPCPVLVIR